jgi:hypothetical protein
MVAEALRLFAHNNLAEPMLVKIKLKHTLLLSLITSIAYDCNTILRLLVQYFFKLNKLTGNYLRPYIFTLQ